MYNLFKNIAQSNKLILSIDKSYCHIWLMSILIADPGTQEHHYFLTTRDVRTRLLYLRANKLLRHLHLVYSNKLLWSFTYLSRYYL